MMLPPDIPRKLKRMPKILRRRREQWEGGSQSRSKAADDVPGLQKLTSWKKCIVFCVEKRDTKNLSVH